MKCPNCGSNIENDMCEHCGWIGKDFEESYAEGQNSNTIEEENEEYGLSDEFIEKSVEEPIKEPMIDSPVIKRHKSFKTVIIISLVIVIVLIFFISLVSGGKGQEQSGTIENAPTSEIIAIDLFQYRNVSEEILIEELGMDKNEGGTYLLGTEATVWCLDGKIQAIQISGDASGKYTFLGVSIGDGIKEAEEKILKCFAYLSVNTEKDIFRNIYQDGTEGILTVEYNMNTDKILSILYEAVDDSNVPEDESVEGNSETKNREEAENFKMQTTEMPKTIEGIDYVEIYDFAFKSVDFDEEYGTYFLWDLDGDGVCELFLGHGKTASDYLTDIWTIREDRSVFCTLRRIYGECIFYVAPDGNGIYAVYGHMGNEKITRITVVDEELLIEVVSERSLEAEEDYYEGEKIIASADINDRSLLERLSFQGEQATFSDEFVFEKSDSTFLNESELEGLSKKECQIARNEIYARHGRLFKDEALQAYFDSCSWYTGTISGDEFDDSVLNEYEIANRDLIAKYEKSQGF